MKTASVLPPKTNGWAISSLAVAFSNKAAASPKSWQCENYNLLSSKIKPCLLALQSQTPNTAICACCWHHPFHPEKVRLPPPKISFKMLLHVHSDLLLVTEGTLILGSFLLPLSKSIFSAIPAHEAVSYPGDHRPFPARNVRSCGPAAGPPAISSFSLATVTIRPPSGLQRSG